MQTTPKGERIHIGFFGKTNVGKSSLINALTNQKVSLVSDVPGTTTDPVYKAMEILPLGPIVLIDTAGINDSGYLGNLRTAESYKAINKVNLAILVVDNTEALTNYDINIISEVKKRNIPIFGIVNKEDILSITNNSLSYLKKTYGMEFIKTSTLNNTGIDNIKEKILNYIKEDKSQKKIIGDLLNKNDIVILVTPMDKSAPKGRLILPQQQTIRDIIDHNAIAVVNKETELEKTINILKENIKMVVSDAQIFSEVNKMVPESIPLTSFSVLFARYKGELDKLVMGASKIKYLKEGNKVLICEACTHHRQHGDIGRDKIPKWLENYIGSKLSFKWVSGSSFPEVEELKNFDLIVHCGACMLNSKEMEFRINTATSNNVPIVNYGVIIAFFGGCLERALQPFPDILALLQDCK